MQLDMWSAEIVVFPVARSVEVGRMARFLLVVQGERADAYYRKVCRQMAKRLRSCGASEARIGAELDAFAAAVRAELLLATSGAKMEAYQ